MNYSGSHRHFILYRNTVDYEKQDFVYLSALLVSQQVSNWNFLTYYIHLFIMNVHVASGHVEVRGQHEGASSLLLGCGLPGSNSVLRLGSNSFHALSHLGRSQISLSFDCVRMSSFKLSI